MVTVPNLTYDYSALEPYISAAIMKLHHTKHHQTYVDKLNDALSKTPSLAGASLVSLLGDIQAIPADAQTAVRNNGGGHYNHSLFWQVMSPQGGGEPTGMLADRIVRVYGGFQQFVDQFTEKALGVFGSGWVWLQPDMTIITTPNQDNPIMSGGDEPLFGLDVWEHAYYLDYQNRRVDYVKAWWDVVDWRFIEARHESRGGS